MINRDEVLELIEEGIARLPEELRSARWLLKEREEFLDKVKREGEDLLEEARSQAERMVQRTEVVRAEVVRLGLRYNLLTPLEDMLRAERAGQVWGGLEKRDNGAWDCRLPTLAPR